METEAAYAVADKLGAAIASRNADNIRAIYADDITIWHPAFNQEMGKVENSGLLAAVFGLTSELIYEEIRRHPIEGGVIQQHVLTGKFADGEALPKLQVCMIIRVRDGLITRIEEYFDAGTFAPVWERLASAN
jgi:ketosteroid isomerase-like protein